jgi:hypothetical protein
MKRILDQPVLLGWLLLLYFDWLMRFGGFERVQKVVREHKVGSTSMASQSAQDLAHAVDLACVFYFKRVLCLQRSAALASLLRRRGIDAEMIIGVQLLPFLSHAWVEVGGHVINDKPYIEQIFQVLDRC